MGRLPLSLLSSFLSRRILKIYMVFPAQLTTDAKLPVGLEHQRAHRRRSIYQLQSPSELPPPPLRTANLVYMWKGDQLPPLARPFIHTMAPTWSWRKGQSSYAMTTVAVALRCLKQHMHRSHRCAAGGTAEAWPPTSSWTQPAC